MIQNYIGWAAGVNRIILDSVQFSVGENAVKTDDLESGGKRTVRKGMYVPDKFTVSMDFNWLEKVGNTGKTEYQLFLDWYKYKHKFGAVPFEFPRILYSSNTGILIYDAENQNKSYTEYYKITSAVAGQKSGECVRVNMSWETVYGGELSIPDVDMEISDYSLGKDSSGSYFVDFKFPVLATGETTIPVLQNFSIKATDSLETPIEWTDCPATSFYYDDVDRVRIYFDKPFGAAVENFYVTFSFTPEHGTQIDIGDYILYTGDI